MTTPPLEQLQTKDLVPFRNLVSTGVGVMLGHLEVPGLTAPPGVPASISPDAVALLRGGNGYGAPPFTGPIFTDDLSGMQAITDRYDITVAVETALESGVDVACGSPPTTSRGSSITSKALWPRASCRSSVSTRRS